MPAITLYLKKDVTGALERERGEKGLDSKPQAASRILEEYFRRKGMLPPGEED
ncbi:hypothetical protein KAW18_15590 [candidate division WOR-3 bacterium]|nr:hypothetical protein [candidate division WOR-3 bacterium]